MKVLEFKNQNSWKKKLLFISFIAVIIMIMTIAIVYSVNEKAREWINTYILKKEISEEDVVSIIIDADKSQYICAYDKYIAMLCN